MSAPGQPLLRIAATGDVPDVDPVGAGMLASMRCVLAFSALLIISLYPTEPARPLELTYVSLAAYCLYSVVLAVISWRADWAPPGRAVHWADVFFYGYLVALTGGASSLFFYFFFFAILVASFSRGFREGISVTLVSFVLFVTAGVAFAPSGNEFELDRTLIHAVYLLVFGYIISHLGGYESLLKGRLRLLREINNPWHPRFGANSAIGLTLQHLLDFYGGSSCTLVLKRTTTPASYLMYRAAPENPDQAAVPTAIVESAAEPLLCLPETLAAFHHDPAGWWPGKFFGHAAYEYDLELQMRTRMVRDECEALAALFDTRAYVTVPYLQRDGASGRLFLARERGRFNQSDISFLAQMSGVMAASVENVCLVEKCVFNAAVHERARISRDLHDTTIQPYIGLKLALDALQRDAGRDNPISVHVAELVAMTAATIRDLRDYTEKLKNNMISMPGDLLAEAIRRQAGRLERIYGIRIEVGIEISPQLSGRIAAEVLQMISEGLSNVLRHTTAKKALVSVRNETSHLVLEIGNEANPSLPGAERFTPRSIHDRAEALGGQTVVEYRDDGYTVVSVTIPV
ncbi:MAG: hypothetical protein HY322_21510 [Betaproteobacteria bacterium]|nr:hypothetical protein [Betaproteobacteria bacterium]